MVGVAVASPPGGAGAPREEAPRPPPPPAPRNGTPSKHGFIGQGGYHDLIINNNNT